MSSDDEIRAAQRALWDEFSPGWEKWDSVVQSVNGPVGEAMIESLELRSDQQHLDVAAGTGDPGLTIAARVPSGRVVITDISPGMLAAARRRADAKGLRNVEFEECSVDDLSFADSSFDSVSCRFGFMFFPDLLAAAREMIRVVKPGGQIVAAVWAGPESNQWATIPGAAISAEFPQPAPDPNAPGMFRCATPLAMTALFRDAGLDHVREWDVPISLDAESPEQYWQMLTELTAPVVNVLKQVDAATRQRIEAGVVHAANDYRLPTGGVRLPATARCIVGTKPA